MKRMLLPLVALLALSCGPIAEQVEGGGASSACATKQDCLSGLVCLEGTCATPPASCQSSLECPDLQICDPAQQVCIPPTPVSCVDDGDCAAAGGASVCDQQSGSCAPPGATGSAATGDHPPPTTDEPPANDEPPVSTDEPPLIDEPPPGDATATEACLPEDEDCELSDDRCCDGFHCCPVFKICVPDWWD